MSGSMIEILGTTPKIGRRSMALADIDPKFVQQNAIWEPSEVETSRGSIRIQHLTTARLTTAAVSAGARPSNTTSGCGTASTLEDCAHFHYDTVELPALKIFIRDEVSKQISRDDADAFSIEVVSGGQSWTIRRNYDNIRMLDEQLHICVWDRSFSKLQIVDNRICNTIEEEEQHDDCRSLVEHYLGRLSELPTNQITCGTVLNWFELDNRGHRHIAISDDAINTPAVAAACALKKYTAQAADELSLNVHDMISVIDMPRVEESVWWRGKRGFHVGFFPRDCVQVIGDKVPVSLPTVPSTRKLQRLSVSSTTTSTAAAAPDKPVAPVLRKHGKLIAFFRSFILSRPSRRRLKQTGILRERVFGCDLAEHLLNTGNDIPAVLKCCAEFIELHGIVDGIYRLSGITSNIQTLRNAFDEDKIPNLDLEEKQDIHAVSSLLKMYFRELPNPLCTYQLYEKFVAAAQGSDADRLFLMREVVAQLPPPHYRTLEYLMKHLARVANKSNDTGTGAAKINMTPKNMAIVWAPNLIRCKELESGGVAALKFLSVQAVVTEYLVRHADLIFNDKLNKDNLPLTTTLVSQRSPSAAGDRPKSLAISSPIRLMSLEEAQDKAKDDRKYIDVGGGPASLPPKYHTVIELPSRRSALKSKRSPTTGWRHFFSRNRSFSKPARKVPTTREITVVMKNNMPQSLQPNWAGLRPVKSVESLVSSPLYLGVSASSAQPNNGLRERDLGLGEPMLEAEEIEDSKNKSLSSPATPVQIVFHPPPPPQACNALSNDPRSLQNPKTHNRSLSHDSYFEFGEFRSGNNVYMPETLEEETMSQESSKLSLDNISSSGLESSNTSPRKECSSGGFVGDTESVTSKSQGRNSFQSPMTPPPSVASIRAPMSDNSVASAISSSSDDYFFVNENTDESTQPKSPLLRPRLRPSKWRDSVVVEEEDSSTSVFTVSGTCHSSDESMPNHNKIRLNNSIFALQEEPEASQFSFKPLVHSSSVSSSKYELDKNSSVDESSAESTPGEHFVAMTNIIYSPLINEISSPTTTTSSSCEQLVVKCNPMAMQTSSLFICPLYEAGVQSSDFSSSSVQGDESPCTTTTTVGSCQAEASAESDGTTTPVTITNNNNCFNQAHEATRTTLNTISFPQYENVLPKEILAGKGYTSCVVTEGSAVTVHDDNSRREQPQQQQESQKMEKHVYQNEHVYENDVGNNVNIKCGSSSEVTEQNKPDTSNVILVVDTDSLGFAKEEEDLYDRHYENVSDSEGEKTNYGGSNIYEDIDDERSLTTTSVTTARGKNNYETVQVSSRSPESSVPTVSSIIVGGSIRGEDDHSDNECEGTYESVQYSTRNGQNESHHQYAEITEKPKATYAYVPGYNLAPSEESSESQSNTEDVVTYLEVQTPEIFKLRSDSLDEQEHIQDQVFPPPTMQSPSEQEEIRHIDSPVIVDNPLYGLEPESNNLKSPETATRESLGSACSITKIEGDDTKEVSPSSSFSTAATDTWKPDKTYARCNSAPLAETLGMSDVALSVPSSNVRSLDCVNPDEDDDDDTEDIKDFSIKSDSALDEKPTMDRNSLNKMSVKTSSTENISKLVLCKRLSEPSLLFANANNSLQTKSRNDERIAAWKIADAKRLANRKQSVKELLSKFEVGKDDTTSCSPNHGSNNNLISSSHGPGLPRGPDSKQNILNNNTSNNLVKMNNNNNNTRERHGGPNGRFQHHRFSAGDILMVHSMTSAEDFRGTSIMVRSDTFPELRTEASKENESGDIVSGQCPHLMSDSGPPIVAEKVQQALKSVDMNDPRTRERIEKYKEERRTFLRQKISSELSGEKSPSSESKGSMCSLKSPDRDMSSTESVFTVMKIIPNTEVVSIRSSESPRKRAFSEDATYFNQTKTIKTDLVSAHKFPTPPKMNQTADSNQVMLSTKLSFDSACREDESQEEEEVNVKEKVSLWTVRRAFSTTSSELTTGATSEFSFHETKDEAHHPFGTAKPILKEAVSLPPEGFTKLPILRRDITSSSIEISKTTTTTKLRSARDGKKIKDMAAFFESKQF